MNHVHVFVFGTGRRGRCDAQAAAGWPRRAPAAPLEAAGECGAVELGLRAQAGVHRLGPAPRSRILARVTSQCFAVSKFEKCTETYG